MKTVKLFRRSYQGSTCIFIYFKYDQLLNRKIKKYPGVYWCAAASSWYIIEEEGCVRDIISYLKNDCRIDATGLHSTRRKTDHQGTKSQNALLNTESQADLSNAKGEADHRSTERQADFLSTESPDELRSTERQARDEKSGKYISSSGSRETVRLTIDSTKGILNIKFAGWYQKRWISELKQYGRPYYDREKKEWHIRANKIIVDSLVDYFSREGLKVMIKKKAMPASQKDLRNKVINEIRQRKLEPEIYEEINNFNQVLKEQRYSRHTLDSYLSHIELFFKYFKGSGPETITNEDLSDFMNSLIIKYGFSASFQNQLLSAIKLYYSHRGRGTLNLDEIKRPMKSRPLPQVLSKKEVTVILQSTRNIKHRLLLSIIYSCGLRRGEVINIKLKDLNRDRKTLHIRSGKGNVDRVVPVSDKVWNKLDEYLLAYSPSVYLFEGQSGGRYSAGSVYHVFCQAVKRAGIEKDIGVHSLRHSYATHLHEGGLDIRYIQELLGHRSSRTTEIYTHVSRRNLLSINNPLDDLDIQ